MAITTSSRNESVRSRTVALTPMNLYLERVKSVTNGVRANLEEYPYTPFQLGGLSGQQQALNAVATINIIDFKVSSE